MNKYQGIEKQGWRRYESKLRSGDFFYQRLIRDGSVLLFSIELIVYDWTKYPQRHGDDHAYTATATMYRGVERFSIDLHEPLGCVENIEEWYRSIYRDLKCTPDPYNN
jgi:hypothetical protein